MHLINSLEFPHYVIRCQRHFCKQSKMNAGVEHEFEGRSKIRYKDRTDEQKKKLLNEKDKKNTRAATDNYMCRFIGYLQLKSHPKIDELNSVQLNGILYDFYSEVQPQKKDGYCVQSMKCMRSGLNRYFRKEMGIDITQDSEFVQANEMFKAVCVEAKRNGKGAKRSTPKISQIDLERIAEYFNYNHLNCPDPRRLQQNMKTFEVVCEPDGTEYVIQSIDEMDKNHGIDDNSMSNEGRMYATNGKNKTFILNTFSLNKFHKLNRTVDLQVTLLR